MMKALLLLLLFPLSGLAQEKETKDCVIIQLYPYDNVVDLRPIQKGTFIPKLGTIDSAILPTVSVTRFKEAIQNSKCKKINPQNEIEISYQGKTYKILQDGKLLALIYNRDYALDIVKKMEQTFLDKSQIQEKICTLISEEIKGKNLHYVVQVKIPDGEYLSEGFENENKAQYILNNYLERGYCSISEEKYTSQQEPIQQALK